MRKAGVLALPLMIMGVLGARAQDPVLQKYEAHATVVNGEVSRIWDARPWVLSRGEHVPVQQTITTGRDGYAHFDVGGGSSFDLFSNSRVVFRENTASAGDLLDVLAGRVRVHLHPSAGQAQQRVFCPTAIISTHHQPATVAVAIDDDDTVRIDVIDGEVEVQHKLLPRNEPTLVRAVDAILVRRDEPISRRVDRGSLYRLTVKILTLGHANHGEPVEGDKLLAASVSAPAVRSF
jgi:hypothetical protein